MKAKKSSTRGISAKFHGAFSKKSAAIKKAESLRPKGKVIGRLVRGGDYRYCVITKA